MPLKLKYEISYEEVRDQILTGDVLLFAHDRSLIAGESRTPYSHAAMTYRVGETLMMAEMRELRGGRVVTVSSQVRRYPGAIDVFRPKCDPQIARRAAELAIRQAGHPYSYRGLAGCTLLHLPVLRRVLRYFPDTTDTTLTPWHSPKFCSQMVAWCGRAAAQEFEAIPEMLRRFDVVVDGWDPVPGLGDRWIEPGHLALSGSYDRLFRGLTHDDYFARNIYGSVAA